MEKKAETINSQLKDNYKDAFYELVLHPIKAMANLDKMYFNAAKNRYYAKRHNLTANDFADAVKALYNTDSLISFYYNHTLANGKWNHMMDQTHIGYKYWQQPLTNEMPKVEYTSADTSLLEVEIITPRSLSNRGFIETDAVISMESSHFTKAINSDSIKWKTIPDIGKTGDGITVFPVNASMQTLNKITPHLEYDFITYDSGKAVVNTYLSPTLNFHNDGLRFAISIDDETPQIINMHEGKTELVWRQWVADNIIIKKTGHNLMNSGKHTLKYWLVDGGIVLQKLVIDFGGLKTSYLGPQETLNK